MADPLADNPSRFDSRQEIREFLREQGADPMDTNTEQQATFGWSLLNQMEDEPPSDRGGRTDRELMLEAEMVKDRLDELGVEAEDWPDVDSDLPDWLEHK